MKNLCATFWKIIGPAICMLILYGCILGGGNGSNGGTNGPSSNLQLVSLKVTASSVPVVPVGGTLQLYATAVYSDSSTNDVTKSSTWVSSNTSIATVNSAGLVQSVAESGSTVITAKYGDSTGSVTNNLQVTVSNSIITSIVITPASINVPLGFYQRLTLTGNLGDGGKVDLTLDPDTAWQSSAAKTVEIIESDSALYPSGGVVVAYAKNKGNAVITATYKNSESDVLTTTAPATVTTAKLESVAIQGQSVLNPNESALYTAIGYFDDGSTFVLNSLSGTIFSSSNTAAVTIATHSGFATGGDALSESSTLTVSYKDNNTPKVSASMVVTLAHTQQWSSEIKSNLSASEYAIAVDSSDNPILFYIDKNSSAAMAEIYRNGNWSSLDNSQGSSAGIVSDNGTTPATSPAITVDHSYPDSSRESGDDVVYVDYTASNGYVTVKKLNLDSPTPTWTTLQAGINNGDNGFSMSSNTIAIDSNHDIYIGFHEHGSSGKIAVLKSHNSSSFTHYGKNNYAQKDGDNSTDLGLAITKTTGDNSVYLGYLQVSDVYCLVNSDTNNWNNCPSSKKGKLSANNPAFNSVAGFYTESTPYAAFEEIISGGGNYISLYNMSYGRIAGIMFPSTTVQNAQTSITLSEEHTDKPVITYVDNNGYIQVVFYPNTGNYFTDTSLQNLGNSPVAVPSDSQTIYSSPKVAVGAHTAWVAYQDENGQIILKKLDNPFN